MIHARGFLEIDARTHEYPDRLWGVREEPRPLAVQIWDNDPHRLAAVGQRLVRQFGASVVDINLGCPVKAVTDRAKSGSYLLGFPERIGQIVERVVGACRPAPVTAKIRLGLTRDTINAIDVAQAVEGAGAAALTVHGRTAEDMFRGSADWDRIAQIKPALKRIPLVGNGDLTTAEMAAVVLDRHPVDGIMIGRAALARPWLFGQIRAALERRPIPPEPTGAQQREILLRHFRLLLQRFDPRRATILMRRYACCYGAGRPGARRFRAEVCGATGPEEFVGSVERFFAGS
jgi:tRNA-dihydrouridine synthase B